MTQLPMVTRSRVEDGECELDAGETGRRRGWGGGSAGRPHSHVWVGAEEVHSAGGACLMRSGRLDYGDG